MVKIAVTLSVMFSFGLAYFVLHHTIWTFIEDKYEEHRYAYAILRTGIVIITGKQNEG